jgi:hypothetical protein
LDKFNLLDCEWFEDYDGKIAPYANEANQGHVVGNIDPAINLCRDTNSSSANYGDILLV